MYADDVVIVTFTLYLFLRIKRMFIFITIDVVVAGGAVD